MKILKFTFILFLFALFSCAESENNSSDTTEKLDITTDTETATVYNISGKPEKGKCFQDGEVKVQPIDDGSFVQIGNHFTGYTDEYGYNIPVVLDDEYSEIFFDGTCENEITGGTGDYRISGIVKNSDPVKNVNPLTKIRSPVARWLFNDNFGTTGESLTEAENLILDYLGMPGLENRFTEMSIENDNTHDAVLLLASSMILYGREDFEQGDYMIQIANGVINNDLDLRTEILNTYALLPIFDIFDNLKASYGVNTGLPPVWNLGYHPAYYADLIENEHTLQGSFNLGDSMGCGADTNYTSYAIPHVFESWIETSKYLSLNLTGEISIWTRGFNQYDRPGTKILDIQELEVDLEGPANLVYSGLLGNHGLTSGTDYYIMIKRELPFRLSTGCSGGFLPFGRKLTSLDDGQSWFGWNNNTTWYRLSGVIAYGLN